MERGKTLRLRAVKKKGKFRLDINIKIEKGFNIILGPSGCGKTTTLRIISGLERADRGFLYYGDRILFDTDKNIFIPPQKRKIALVFQDNNLLPHLTVRGNIEFAIKKSESPVDLNRMMDKFGIKEILGRFPHQISGGERQKVALLRAIASNPDILLMDEPFSSLDFDTKYDIMRILKEKTEMEIPVIIVTHDPMEAYFLGEKVFFMKDGRIVEEGDKEAIKRKFKHLLRFQ